MAGTGPEVGVIGLAALNRDIKRLCIFDGGKLNEALKAAGRSAAEPVAAATRSVLPQVDTRQHAAGTMAGDVRLLVAKSGAKVAMGRKSLPYAGPLEFGWPSRGRQYIATGRYLYPSARLLADVSAQRYTTATQQALDAFDWTNAGEDGAAIHD